MRFSTPTWLAARPTPGASYIVAIMSSASLARRPSMLVTSAARWRSTGSPTTLIEYGAMARQAIAPARVFPPPGNHPGPGPGRPLPWGDGRAHGADRDRRRAGGPDQRRADVVPRRADLRRRAGVPADPHPPRPVLRRLGRRRPAVRNGPVVPHAAHRAGRR